MNFLILAVVLTIVAAVNADYPKEAEEEYNVLISECRTKFVITDEEYTMVRRAEVAEPDENMQCLVNCFMEKAGIIKDGVYQKDVASILSIKKIGEEKTKKVMAACGDEKGSTNCETAYKLHKCFTENKVY